MRARTGQPKGSYPHAEFAWSAEDYTIFIGALFNWCLVFVVELPATGSVWRELGQQIVDHIRDAGFVFDGYPMSSSPDGPTKLPVILLSTSPRSQAFVKTHAPYDDLTPGTFTAEALKDKRFTCVKYPLDNKYTAENLPFLKFGMCFGSVRLLIVVHRLP